MDKFFQGKLESKTTQVAIILQFLPSLSAIFSFKFRYQTP